MSEAVRVARATRRTDADASADAHVRTSGRAAPPSPAPAWAAGPAGPALALGVQRKPVIGPPDDEYEEEADVVAARVTSGRPAPVETISTVGAGAAAAQRLVVGEGEEEEDKTIVQRKEDGEEDLVQRVSGEGGMPGMQDAAAAAVRSPGPGSTLPSGTRSTLESRMGADLGDVRVHTGPAAESASARLHARAFTHGGDIWLGKGESPADVSLMAHEVTHVFQQNGVVRRRPSPPSASVRTQGHAPAGAAVQRTAAGPGLVQRLIPDWLLEEAAEYARYIPGWTLFTLIIGFNPLTRRDVPRNAVNLLQALMELVPFGNRIFDALRERGIIQDAFTWIEGELDRFDLSRDRLGRTLEAAWDDVSLTSGLDYNIGVLERHFGGLYRDVRSFARSLVDHLVGMIKEAAIRVAEGLLEENRAWSLIKKVLGRDPLRDEPVEATPTEILEDFLLLIGKEEHLAQMRERGTVEETADWLATQIQTFMSLLGELRGLFEEAWDAIQPENLPRLVSNLQALAVRAGGFLQRVWDFASTVAIQVLELIKNALLSWLSSFAHEVPGFHLITVILGRNPFTGEAVPRTAQNLIRGFITLLPGGNQIYAELEETGAVEGAAQRIEGALEALGISWSFIVGLFRGIWESLSINDLVDPIGLFSRVVERFGEPISRLVAFVGVVLKEMVFLILQMMNFPFDLIGSIVGNAMQAIEDIKNDPIGFLSNMLEAVKLGFSNFFDNIVTHLVGGLADWLFRGLRDAGIEPPQDLSLASVLDFVLEVLGISVERMWEKLADRIGEENVERIRGAIDRVVGIWNFIRDVQQRGIGAIWEYIEGQITGLWDMVLQKAQDWIMERIINRAIQWLMSLLDVTGIMPVINAFVAFFNAVQSAIEYMRDVLAIINEYVATVAAVARGELEPGAQRLEGGLASAIPVAIGFLANQFGLGNIGEKIQEIVAGIRGYVDRALDWLIERAVEAVQGLLRTLGFGGEEEGIDTGDPEHDAAVAAGLAAIGPAEEPYLHNGRITREDAETVARAVREQHPIFTQLQVVDGGDSWNYEWAASEGSEADTPSEKAEVAATSSFSGRRIDEPGIESDLAAEGYTRPHLRLGRWRINRISISSGLPKLSVVDGVITVGPAPDEEDRGEIAVELGALLASLPEHPHRHLFRIDPTGGQLRLGSSLRKEALSSYRPRTTTQMRREIDNLIFSTDETAGLIEIPVGGSEDLVAVEERGGLGATIDRSGLRSTAMSETLIASFIDLRASGWPNQWEVHHVVPTDWGGHDGVHNYAAIPADKHEDITRWWNTLRNMILRDADAAAARENGTTAEYHSIRFE